MQANTWTGHKKKIIQCVPRNMTVAIRIEGRL